MYLHCNVHYWIEAVQNDEEAEEDEEKKKLREAEPKTKSKFKKMFSNFDAFEPINFTRLISTSETHNSNNKAKKKKKKHTPIDARSYRDAVVTRFVYYIYIYILIVQ